MARVRAVEPFFDNLVLRQPGEEFDYNGAPGDPIEFLDKDEEAKAAAKHREEQVKKKRNDIEAEVRRQLEVEIRAEAEKKLRAEIEAEVKAELKAKLKAAGKDDDLV